MVCGELVEFSVTVMVAASGPVVVGAKRTPIMQREWGPRLPPNPPPAAPSHVFEVTNELVLVPPSVMVLK
jgi:hypothetical protein